MEDSLSHHSAPRWMVTKGPIFLCGSDRSGAGLVGEMLEMHPAFSLTRRTNFFSHYESRFTGLTSVNDARHELEELLRDRRYKLFEPDAEAALDDFIDGDWTAARMFESLQVRRMQRLGRRRWGDKSLWSEQHADAILESYPSAVMVQVVRDPRDQFASFKFHRRDGRVSAGVGAAMLRRSAGHARRNEVEHPGRYFILKYENLVADPQAAMRRLCDQLGEEFTDAVFEQATDVEGRPSSRRVIHRASVGRYRSDLTATEIATVEHILGGHMTHFGYEPVGQLRGVRRFAFFGLQLPTALTQAAAWNLRSALRRIRGPRPSTSRLSA